jgi:RNA polymerase sigma-70 factor (ECF subfamily)
LLARAAAGDPSAVGRLLDRHRDQLRAFVAARLDPAVRARVDASDVVQDALADAARRLPDYLVRRPMPFHLWVLKSAYERTLQARRTHRAGRRDVAREESPLDASSLALAESLVAPGQTPSAAVQVREGAQRVCRALDDLSEDDREILVMRLVDRLPYEEVAVLFEIESQTARRRFGRALIRLRKALVAHGLQPDTFHV